MLVVEKMTSLDLAKVMEIEKHSMPVTSRRETFERELSLPMARNWVAKREGQVCGYLNCWQVDQEIHIMVIAVLPEERRKGIGAALFDHMVNETPQAKTYHLELRQSNEGAKAFYEKYGFQVIAQRKKYYQNNQEDALLMKWQRKNP